MMRSRRLLEGGEGGLPGAHAGHMAAYAANCAPSLPSSPPPHPPLPHPHPSGASPLPLARFLHRLPPACLPACLQQHGGQPERQGCDGAAGRIPRTPRARQL